jgi:hypothetical protein
MFQPQSGQDNNHKVTEVLTSVTGSISGFIILVFLIAAFGWVLIEFNIAHNDLFPLGKPPGTTNHNVEVMFRYYVLATACATLPLLFCAGLASSSEKVPAYAGTFISAVCVIVLLILFCVSLVGYGFTANTPGYANNMADDMRKCCISEFYTNPANLCPNTYLANPQCTPQYDGITKDMLKWNTSYTFILFMKIPIMLFGIAIGISCFMSVKGEAAWAQFTKMLLKAPIRAIFGKQKSRRHRKNKALPE